MFSQVLSWRGTTRREARRRAGVLVFLSTLITLEIIFTLMICPVCHKTMVTKSVKGYNVDVCTTCEGMWTKDKILEELFKLKIQRGGRILSCPECKDQKMVKETSGNVEVDVCPACGRVWLDKNELTKLWFAYKPK